MRQSVVRLVSRAAIAGGSKGGKADESSHFSSPTSIPRLGGSPQGVGTVENEPRPIDFEPRR